MIYAKRLLFIFNLITLLVAQLVLSSCASAPTYRILDAKTKEPIEGAVALATWIGSKGIPGFYSSYIKKAIEGVSDANGVLQMPAVYGSFVLFSPRLKIYKAGYVGWDSHRIYIGCYETDKKLTKAIRRENFVTKKDQDIYLEPWKDEYTFVSHGSFIAPPLGLKKGGLTHSKYREAISYEIPFRVNERRKSY